MGTCERRAEDISAMTDGELSAAEENELRAHIAECNRCRSLHAELCAMHDAFPALTEPPETLLPGILYKRGAEQAAPSRVRRIAASLVGIAACLLFALFLSGRDSGVPLGTAESGKEGTKLTEQTESPENAAFALPEAGLEEPADITYDFTQGDETTSGKAPGAASEKDGAAYIHPAETSGIYPSGTAKPSDRFLPSAGNGESTAGEASKESPLPPARQSALLFLDALPESHANEDYAFFAVLSPEGADKTGVIAVLRSVAKPSEDDGLYYLSEASLREIALSADINQQNELIRLCEDTDLGLLELKIPEETETEQSKEAAEAARERAEPQSSEPKPNSADEKRAEYDKAGK